MPRTRACLLTALLACGAAAADTDPERIRVEREMQHLLQDIARLQRELQSSRTEHAAEQQRLRALDLAIQDVNLEYRSLAEQKSVHQAELARLETQRDEYLASIDQRLAQLAEQVRSAYRVGAPSRTRLLLNQDDPSRIGRMLAYYDYVNRAQVERVAGLREALARLEALQAPVDAEIERIAELQAEQQAVLEELERQRADRLALVQAMSLEIGDRESALTELERNRRDLQELIDRLADILADIPEDLENEAGVAARKGRLPMPVSGPVRHAFGQDRGAGLDWQGWLIGAEAGTEVRSVAHGRVAFADWLRGYGMLLVIDHGDGFMTLYGHNESLLHEAGEWDNGGDVVSTVGSNPGGTQGAYFEIRRDGKALDPSAWLAR